MRTICRTLLAIAILGLFTASAKADTLVFSNIFSGGTLAAAGGNASGLSVSLPMQVTATNTFIFVFNLELNFDSSAPGPNFRITDTSSSTDVFTGTIGSFNITGCGAEDLSCAVNFNFPDSAMIDPGFAALLGVPGGSWMFSGYSQGGRSDNTQPFTADSTDIVATSVPEPVSISLFSSGIGMLGMFRRRMFRK